MRTNQLLFRIGTTWTVYEALTGFYLIAFAVKLGASDTIAGLLGSLPFFAMMLSEFLGVKLMEGVNRKWLSSVTSMLPRLLWLVMPFLPSLTKRPILAMAVLYFVLRFVEFLGDPAWTSLVGDLIKEKTRSSFFGRRFHYMTFWNTLALLLSGFYLSGYDNYALLFILGAFVGIFSGWLKGKSPDKPSQNHHHYVVKEFLHVKGDFLHFCFANVLFRFGVMMIAPLFVVYFVRDLNLSMGFYSLVIAVLTITKFVVYPLMGKMADHVGAKPLALLGMFGASFVPLLLLLVPASQPWWFILINVWAGITWAIIDVTSLSMLMDLTKPKTRPVMVAEFNTIAGIANALGPLLGGLLADHAVIVLSGIPLVFAISFVLRLVSLLPMLHLPETRVQAKPVMRVMFKDVSGWHPTKEIGHELKVVCKHVRGY